MYVGSHLHHPLAIPGVVSIQEGNGGLAKVVITTGTAQAEIYLNGAAVTRYETGGRALLFCSHTSKFEPGKAVRGGVPIIFPWFGPHPTDPKLGQHGFARAAEWTLAATNATIDDEAAVVLTLESSDATHAVWPYDFSLRYTVTVRQRLEMALEVTNRSAEEFRFEEALHTYLAVSDVRQVRITGLENTEYFDKVEGMARKRLDTTPLTLVGETDRVFIDTPADCRVHDPSDGDIMIRKQGSLSTVVWNPWDAKAEALPDLAGGQWTGMLCVETANALENAITLAPGASHTLTAIIDPAA